MWGEQAHGQGGSMTTLPTLDPDRCALFLDYDGTLVGLAPTPGEALADAELRDLLGRLHQRLHGALAIVTGRPVADIDGFLAPLRLTVSGLHGLVRRRHDGTLTEVPLAPGLLDTARREFAEFAARHPGTLMEDKGLSIALHFRQAPATEDAASSMASRIAEASDGAIRLQRGKMVVELLPAGSDKGVAISALAQCPDFHGRLPIFVGDDVTDEAGFRAVNRLGGISIRVGGGPSAATRAIAGVPELRRWLAEAAQA
jgi:trehalose 6-phosphate phosphatase